MEIVLDILLPVFGVLLLGFGAARAGLFDAAAIRGLSLFVFTFAIPLLLFRSMALTDLPDEIPWGFLASYYLGAFAVFGLAMLSGVMIFGRRLDEQGIFGLGAAFSNTTLLGIPLVLTTFGEAAALPLFLLIAFHSLLLLPVVTVVIETSRGRGGALRHIPWNTAKELGKNPIILGLLVGLCFALFGLTIPGPLDSMARTLGAAASPCALFAMGGTLSQHRIAGSLIETLCLTGLKTLVHPLLVWILASRVFEVTPLWSTVAVIMAALPPGVTVYLFAQRYHICVRTATTTVFLATVFSVFSLSVCLFWFEVR